MKTIAFSGSAGKPKYVVNLSYTSLIVGFVNSANANYEMDTDHSHFSSLAICDPLEFADTIECLISNRDNPETYRNTDYRQLGNGFDRIYFTRNCNTLSINRGGCSNLFMGCIDLLRKLPTIIRKEYTILEHRKNLELIKDGYGN